MIELWREREFLARLDDVMGVYAAAFGEDPAGQRAISARHATYPDFACAAASDGGQLLGFCYGTAGERGQWWHDRVVPAASQRAREEWFDDYFGVAELAVRPDAQGRGLGRELVRALLAAPAVRRHSRVLLMTDMDNAVALALYASLGFEDVLTDFRFSAAGTPKRVMGLRLDEPILHISRR